MLYADERYGNEGGELYEMLACKNVRVVRSCFEPYEHTCICRRFCKLSRKEFYRDCNRTSRSNSGIGYFVSCDKAYATAKKSEQQ